MTRYRITMSDALRDVQKHIEEASKVPNGHFFKAAYELPNKKGTIRFTAKGRGMSAPVTLWVKGPKEKDYEEFKTYKNMGAAKKEYKNLKAMAQVDEAKFKHPDAGVPLSVRRARKKKSAAQMKGILQTRLAIKNITSTRDAAVEKAEKELPKLEKQLKDKISAYHKKFGEWPTVTEAAVMYEEIEELDEAKFKHPDAGVPLSVRRARKKKSAAQMKKDMKHAEMLSKTNTGKAPVDYYRESEIKEVSPPGFKGTVKAMKKHKDIDNPYALAWYMKNKGNIPQYKNKDGTPEKKEKYKNIADKE